MIDLTNKTVYLSGGITGVPDYKAAFDRGRVIVKAAGAKVVFNPADLPPGYSWEIYMAGCLGILRVCNAIVMLPGWKRSTGARMERGLAMTLAMPCYELAELTER
jgi:hypothetical protein